MLMELPSDQPEAPARDGGNWRVHEMHQEVLRRMVHFMQETGLSLNKLVSIHVIACRSKFTHKSLVPAFSVVKGCVDYADNV